MVSAVPFRPANRRKQNSVHGFSARHVRFADRRAMCIIGLAADEALFDLEMGDARLCQPSRDLFDLGHNLGANAVSRKDEEFVLSHFR